MLFWTKLLTMAHAVTTSIHPYLCLYYIHMLQFDILTICLLTAGVILLRVPASIFWIDIVDHRSPLHGIFTALLTALGAAGILLILSVPPTWTAIALPVAIISSILDGLFYQPLECLIDSAIIKILGDYKIKYDNERKYGKWIAALMTAGIGIWLDNDHDFDTLMVVTLVGAVMLFLLSLSTNVQPADPNLLGIPCHQEDQVAEEVQVNENSPLLSKGYTDLHQQQPKQSPLHHYYYHHQPQQHQYPPPVMTETANFVYYTYHYKPYSLFGEQLSHISEEDASILQRMATTTNNSVSIMNNNSSKNIPRPASCSVSTYSFRNQQQQQQQQQLQRQPSFQQINPVATSNSAVPDYEDSAYYVPISSNTTTVATTTGNDGNASFNLPQQSNDFSFSEGEDGSENNDEDDEETVSLPPSFEIARLPFPPTVSPMIVLSLLLNYSTTPFTNKRQLQYYQQQQRHPQHHSLHRTSIEDYYTYQQQPAMPQMGINGTVPATTSSVITNTHIQQQQQGQQQQPQQQHYYHLHLPSTNTKWITRSFIGSSLCLGIAVGLTRSLLFYYLHIVLEFPMHLLGIVGFLTVIADLLASQLVLIMFVQQRLQLSVVVGCIHICLIVCTLSYTWLTPVSLMSQIIVLFLHFTQSVAFYIIWLLSAHQVDTVILADNTRLLLKGGMAAAYSSLGPVVGLLLVGYFASANENALEGYSLVYQYAAGFTVISAILSWEWSTTE